MHMCGVVQQFISSYYYYRIWYQEHKISSILHGKVLVPPPPYPLVNTKYRKHKMFLILPPDPIIRNIVSTGVLCGALSLKLFLSFYVRTGSTLSIDFIASVASTFGV